MNALEERGCCFDPLQTSILVSKNKTKTRGKAENNSDNDYNNNTYESYLASCLAVYSSHLAPPGPKYRLLN